MSPTAPVTGSFGPNAWLVDDMYERFLVDPSSVSESWREFFSDYRPAPVPAPVARVEAPVAPPAPPPPPPPSPSAPVLSPPTTAPPATLRPDVGIPAPNEA